MKFIFDTSENSNETLHDILGFVDATFTMFELMPYLRKSTRKLIGWIGQKNYDIAVARFEANSDDEYVHLVRFCIAMSVWKDYAPLSDVSHTSSGRSFRSDDHMKTAFEWQIDKSDDNLEKSYYDALDEVISFIIEFYKEPLVTDDYEFDLPPRLKRINNLIVNSLDIFQESVQINDSYLLFLSLISALERAETQLIKPRTGAKLDDYLKDNDSPIKGIIRTICVYYAMADGLKKNSVQLFPRSVFQENKNGKNAAKRLDVEATYLYYQDENKILLQELEKLIAKDKNKIMPVAVINFDKDDSFVTM